MLLVLREMQIRGWQVDERWAYPTQRMQGATAIWAGRVLTEPSGLRVVLRVRLLIGTPDKAKPTWFIQMVLGPEGLPSGAAEREGARTVAGCAHLMLAQGGVPALSDVPLAKLLRLTIDQAVQAHRNRGFASEVAQLDELLVP